MHCNNVDVNDPLLSIVHVHVLPYLYLSPLLHFFLRYSDYPLKLEVLLILIQYKTISQINEMYTLFKQFPYLQYVTVQTFLKVLYNAVYNSTDSGMLY